MNIGKIDRQVLKMLNVARTIRKVRNGANEHRYMKDACYKFSEITSRPLTEIQNLTRNATPDQFVFLKTMINKFNYKKLHSLEDSSEHVFNIYSMVEKPSALHLNIVRKNNDSFESLEKIFSLAKDKKTLQFVEDLQYTELKNSDHASKIIVDLLSSKNKDKFLEDPERYSSYIELHSDDADAVKTLDELINTGKFNRLKFDAQLAVKNLFKKRKIETVMSGKTNDLAKMYSEERAGFLQKLINNFIPSSVKPKEETKAVVVDMYNSLTADNAELRNAIIERFRYINPNNKTAEIIEMQKLFNKIDKDNNAKVFVKKAISKDLKVASITELNEILDSAPLKKANIFFNNAKRIIEHSTGDERKSALITELENPFFKSKTLPVKNTRLIRMYSDKPEYENWFSRAYKIIENKINQYRYNKLVA